ncbi:hypothetical protein MRB53_005427 [Persea americana]|uniref:Uncharacterized protein n=1 Tax=Persea americana TaxID=3435 RepID=A0ACC2MEA5_PERAE|nr:hypothetical protein MRB53_005427 [Persea americana]
MGLMRTGKKNTRFIFQNHLFTAYLPMQAYLRKPLRSREQTCAMTPFPGSENPAVETTSFRFPLKNISTHHHTKEEKQNGRTRFTPDEHAWQKQRQRSHLICSFEKRPIYSQRYRFFHQT